MHTYMCTNTHTRTNIEICPCMLAYKHTSRLCIHIRAHTHVQIHKRHKHANIHMFSHIYTHIYTNKHTHTSAHVFGGDRFNWFDGHYALSRDTVFDHGKL